MRRSLSLGVALVALVVLAACGDETSYTEPTDTQPTIQPTTIQPTTTQPTGAPAAGVPAALQFTAPLVGGGTLDFADYSGRTVALWFWAPT